MIHKIFTYTGISLLALIAIGYFIFASTLYGNKKRENSCKGVSVEILDSSYNRFVTKADVVNIIEEYNGPSIGKRCNEINLNNIERLLSERSAIKEAQVSLAIDGLMRVEITQRRPILRIESPEGGFYIDEDEYIFPLVESFTSYVPIVTGHVPLEIESGFRGKLPKDKGPWISQILELGRFLNSNPFWGSMVAQIYVERNGDIILLPKVGDIKITFGSLGDIEEKFRKLLAFYKNIAPEMGWERYSEVNVKYKGQIVCKLDSSYIKSKES